MRKPVFLVGMPGVGKSYWGALWATHYSLPFVDIDAEIARVTGKSSAAIIQEQGEPAFREIEATVLHTVVAPETAMLIATGGGTPAFKQNMDWMLDQGIVVWLQADVAYLVNKLRNSPVVRPLLPGENMEEALVILQEKRIPFYQKAQLHYPAGALTIATFAAIQEACINLH